MRRSGLLRLLILLASQLSTPTRQSALGAERPTIELTAPNTLITQSCLVVIPSGGIIPDPNGAGVIVVGASDIEIEFDRGSALRGSPTNTPPDQYRGYGIRLNGHRGVTIRGADVSGFWCGLWATKADRLVIEAMDASDNRRARLKSTPAAEDTGDWLYGHNNDQHEWLTNYGAALYVEQSSGITVRDSRVWHGQNALCLDRVTESRIYDNDFSFNSGWGIALWRSSKNVISHNALDFCVRGYSHGVYNRGQDSAGILAFEQNNENILAENSVTHGGDGFFGFAGREAIGETGEHPPAWYRRRGNSDNWLIGNDFSYAAAHGIENTFSFGNGYVNNRLVGNAICGIWAGYSRETLIASNHFEANGEMGYGLERGGVNIDHGGDNVVIQNSFRSNRCGIHLWGGENADFAKKNWARVNGIASTGSVIEGNRFDGDRLAFHFRGPGQVKLGANDLGHVVREIEAEPAYEIIRQSSPVLKTPRAPTLELPGRKRPVGARSALRGRENIIMTEWGPWDHEGPLVRLIKSVGGSALYEVRKVPPADVRMEVLGEGVRGVLTVATGLTNVSQITVTAGAPGVHSYALKVYERGKPLANFQGTLVTAAWDAAFFQWPTNTDPRENLQTYRQLAEATGVITVPLPDLTLRYGMRGPSDLGLSAQLTAARLGADHFGMVARTRLPLTKGEWEFVTLSDDGVRVTVDGHPVVENWTWHGPTRNSGRLTLTTNKTVEISVEHFEIDGYAVLEFSIAKLVPQTLR